VSETCEVCALEYWPNFSHCRDCHRTWTGHAEAHCSICHHHFTSNSAFDAHLAPSKAEEDCYDPETITNRTGEPRFVAVDRKHGPTWAVNRPDLIAKETVLRHLRGGPEGVESPEEGPEYPDESSTTPIPTGTAQKEEVA
jgi:hypothetical protein